MLVTFFSYKAPLSATDDKKELVINRPRALPCLGSSGTAPSAGPSILFFFFSLGLHILVYSQVYCVSDWMHE